MPRGLEAECLAHYQVWLGPYQNEIPCFIDYARQLPASTDAEALTKIACCAYAYSHGVAGAQNILEAISTVVGLV